MAATLDLSTHALDIKRTVEAVQNGQFGSHAENAFAHWAIFTVVAPLVNAFQPTAPSKGFVLKLAASGHGDLAEIADEFSDGRLHYAFVRVRDPASKLPKQLLINWCGLSVPDRIKGNYDTFARVFERTVPSTHLQIAARSSEDIEPAAILEKVSKASGAKYENAAANAAPAVPASSRPPPPRPIKPAAPTRISGAARPAHSDLDSDGWGNAPQVTRSTLEKVPSAYQPVTVKLAGMAIDKPEPGEPSGSYKPVGKVDIEAIRRDAKARGESLDSRAEPVKGTYQPIGKVDIAAIRAQAKAAEDFGGQRDEPEARSVPKPAPVPVMSGSASTGGRLTSLPRPAVGGTKPVFGGTKPPAPASFQTPMVTPAAQGASRTFANADGKSPAQLWAEKKAREGKSASSTGSPSGEVTADKSGDKSGWKSTYTGRSWAPVNTSHVSRAGASDNGDDEAEGEGEPVQAQLSGRVSDVRHKFSQAPPPLAMGTKPPSSAAPAVYAAPPSPPAAPRSPSPVRESSPVRIAMPVSRSAAPPEREREPTPEPVPARPAAPAAGGKRAIAMFDYEKEEDNEIELAEGQYVTEIEMVDDDWWMGKNHAGETGLFPSNYVELVEEEAAAEPARPVETARAAPAAAPAPVAEAAAPAAAAPVAAGKTATAIFDYEAEEDNELSFGEGDKVTSISFPDDDWWFGHANGREGLFPSNYVELDG